MLKALKKEWKQWQRAYDAWFNANFCWQLVCPEYKGHHVTNTYKELCEWLELYPADTVKLVIAPKF